MAQAPQLNIPAIKLVSELPVQSMPKLNNAKLRTKEIHRRQSNVGPAKFAFPFEVDFSAKTSGTWEQIGEEVVWSLIIESKGAFSLNLGFTDFYLPPSARLFIYDYYGQSSLRPFVPSDNEDHLQMWSPIVSSDKVVVKVVLNVSEKRDLRLRLNYVNHDFMDIQRSISDACHIDVKCGSNDGYPGVDDLRDQIRSVGLYTVGGVSVCSGFLINNTRQDCRPYFMTANHCNLNKDNAASMVTYWNYENSYCRQPGSFDSAEDGDGILAQFNTGGVIRATWADSDFTLVEMDDEIPTAANAYFSGWDISSNPPSRGVVIHHPNLEEKRISFKYSPLYLGEWGQEASFVANGSHLIVNDWDLGSTDDGSSGAPLFNRNGLAVGQLHGGLAKCDNQGYDAFGRLFSSWTGGGLPDNRLKDWLDPDNLGVLSLQGRNCAFNIDLSDNNFTICKTDGFFEVGITVNESFQGPVLLTFQNLPEGAFAFYDNFTVVAGQTAKLEVSNLQNLSAGNYNITIVAQDQVQTQSVSLNFEIIEEVTNAPVLSSPLHQSTIDIENANITWDLDSDTNLFKLQIAQDPDFTVNLNEHLVYENNFDASDFLVDDRLYYCRVKSVNECGESAWSSISQFLTVTLICYEEQSTNVFEISAQAPDIIRSPIWIESEGTVLDITVTNILGEHSFVGDLKFSLICPSGREVMLVKDQCSSFDDFDFGFSDSGLDDINCPFTDRLIYKPQEALSGFNGESAIGEWILKVDDKNAFDGGLLRSWSLELCVNPKLDYSLTGALNTLEICTNESYMLPLFVGTSFSINSDLTFESNIPSIAEVRQDEGQINLLINPSGMAPPGNYPVIIELRDQFGNVADYQIDVVVIDVPAEFDLTNPDPNMIFEDENILFNWTQSTFAVEYIVTITSDELFQDIIIKDTLFGSSYLLEDVFLENGVYFYSVAAYNRCGFQESEIRSFSVDQTNGVDNSQETALVVYPNPANTYFNIQNLTNTALDVELSIQTIDGTVIFKEELNLNKGNYKMPVLDWPSGVYIVSMAYLSQVQISRIVVQ